MYDVDKCKVSEHADLFYQHDESVDHGNGILQVKNLYSLLMILGHESKLIEVY